MGLKKIYFSLAKMPILYYIVIVKYESDFESKLLMALVSLKSEVALIRGLQGLFLVNYEKRLCYSSNRH